MQHHITAQNAREIAAKSWAPGSRRYKHNKQQPLAQLQPMLQQMQSALPHLLDDAVRVRKRLHELDQSMAKASSSRTCDCPKCGTQVQVGADSREWDNLSRSYERLFRVWMVLSGTPGSGQRKPPPLRTQRTLDVLPEPIQLVQANPGTVPVPPSTGPVAVVAPVPDQPGAEPGPVPVVPSPS